MSEEKPKPETPSKQKPSKLRNVIEAVPEILAKLDNPEYDEIFGYRINVEGKEHVNVKVRDAILNKFLAASEGDVEVTKKKLVETLNWRNKFQPLSAAFKETFPKELSRIGVITRFGGVKNNLGVVTWNLYGEIEDPKKFFEVYSKKDEGSTDNKQGTQFLRWRIGIMEQSLAFLDFLDPQNDKLAQVHDYENVSMFRMDPNLRAATKEIVAIFSNNYPELLSVKFFVCVPSLMSWVFSFLRKIGIISAQTMNKFQVLNNANLSQWFKSKNLPKKYNGGTDSKIKLLYDLDATTAVKDKIPAYAKVILQNLESNEIEKNNLSVE